MLSVLRNLIIDNLSYFTYEAINHVQIAIVNFMHPLTVAEWPGSWVNIISGLSVRVFLKEFGIWNSGLKKVDCPPQWNYHLIQQGAWTEQIGGGGVNYFCLTSWAGYQFSPVSWAFGSRLESIPSAPWFLSLQTTSVDMNGFPGSLACRWQIMGLLCFHNHIR